MNQDIKKSISLVTLRIKDPSLEKDYQKSVIKQSMNRYRIAILSGILFYLAFSYVESFTYPTAHDAFTYIKLTFIVPCLAIIFIVSYTRVYLYYARLINVIAVLLAGFGIAFMAYIGSNEPEISRLYVGLIIIFFYLYAFINISYLCGLFVGLTMMTIYLAIAWYVNEIPIEIFINILFGLVAINVIGVIVAYIIEHHSKSEYLLRLQLSETILLDELTGLYNRYYFKQIVISDLEKFIRSSENLVDFERRNDQLKAAKYGMIMLDIDYFKRVNDTFGHHSGDLVLKQFAHLLRSNIRMSDDIIRFGGEEFLLVIKLTSYEYLLELVKKLGRLIENYDFVIEGKRVIGCTASMGLVVIPETEAKDVEELVDFADRALYFAKENGRNKAYRGFSDANRMCYEELSWS